MRVESVSCQEASAGGAGALFLDVRTPAEFAAAHIPGAVLHPLTDLAPGVVQQLAVGKERCIIVCRSGNRARQAAEKLAGVVPNVVVLEGGLTAWESAGMSVVRGKEMMSLERQVRITAGGCVVLGTLLGAFVHPAWYGLSALIGAGLVFSGVTDTCGMALFLAKMPWNTRCEASPTAICTLKK